MTEDEWEEQADDDATNQNDAPYPIIEIAQQRKDLLYFLAVIGLKRLEKKVANTCCDTKLCQIKVAKNIP